MSKQAQLSAKTIATLEDLARGQTYEQMLGVCRGLSCGDISEAAQEVITRIIEGKSKIDEIRERYPRAYMKWTPEEDEQVERMVREGNPVSRIAGRLGRARPAIRARVIRLNLVDSLSAADKAKVERHRDRYGEDCSGAGPQEGETHEPFGKDVNKSDREVAVALGSTVERSSQTAAQRMGHPLARSTPALSTADGASASR